jgi:hypothetical protein
MHLQDQAMGVQMSEKRLSHLGDHDSSKMARPLTNKLAAAEHWHSIGVVRIMDSGAMYTEFMPACDVAAMSLYPGVRELALA